MRTRTRVLTTLAAAVLTLGACSDQTPVSDEGTPTRGADRGDRTPKGDDPTAPTSPTETSASGGDSGEQRTVAVYFVGDTERAGPRLYREFQRVTGDPLEAAASLLTAGRALDPDYRTLFPGGSFESIEYVSGAGAIIATVPDDGWNTRAPGMTKREARLAVQQLVYTLQAVQQERLPVVVQLGNSPVPLFGIARADGLRNAEPLSTLSHLSLTSPEQGSVVRNGTLKVSGVGNSFEANVGWEIRQGDRVVKDGFATMEGWMEPRLFPFKTTVDVSDLPPGDYTFWATTDDPTGGTEGIGAMTDDKSFSIK